MMQRKENKLLNPASAIENYFDILLQDADPDIVASKPVRLKSKLLILSDLEAELSSIDEIETQEEILLPEGNSKQLEKKQDVVLDQEQPVYSDRIKFPVQCLIFYVNEYQLSIPLADMLSVVSEVKNLTRLPQAPDWFPGVIKHRESNINIADSAQLLSINSQQEKTQDYHVLVLKDACWGITCTRLGEIILLSEEDLKWSKPDSKGLALGVIKKSLTILLDTEKILARVHNESNQKDLVKLDNSSAE